MTRHIFADEVVNDGCLEEFSLVGDDVLNAEATTHLAGVVKVLGVALLLVETECHADYLSVPPLIPNRTLSFGFIAQR